jgi:hypothetical protein
MMNNEGVTDAIPEGANARGNVFFYRGDPRTAAVSV